MRRSYQTQSIALFLLVATGLLAGDRLFGADRPNPIAVKTLPTTKTVATSAKMVPLAAAKPLPPSECPVLAKLKSLGSQLQKALELGVDVLSGNKADLLSNNKPNLLSGNKPNLLSGNSPKLLSGNSANLLSGNKPNLLSGNKTKLLSDNKTPIFSGNTISLFSNIKIEIHIENRGNSVSTGGRAQPFAAPTPAGPTPFLNPAPQTR
jgi:hypothetical protein